MLNNSGLRIDRKIYYNFIRGKPLGRSSDLFKGLILALEKVGFRFAYKMKDELADNNTVIERVLKQVFFATDTQLA
jgi:hypothetical protein